VHVQPSYGDGRTESASGPAPKRQVDTECQALVTELRLPPDRCGDTLDRSPGGWGFGME
jgi:hypothetical protein